MAQNNKPKRMIATMHPSYIMPLVPASNCMLLLQLSFYSVLEAIFHLEKHGLPHATTHTDTLCTETYREGLRFYCEVLLRAFVCQCLFREEGFLTYSISRLNLQHYLWKDQTGYLIHPSVPLSNPNIKIADIGTGTGYEALNSRPLLRSTTAR